MASVMEKHNFLYDKKTGAFVHPERFLRVIETKTVKGQTHTTTRLRDEHIFNMKFDVNDPLNPKKNNIEVFLDKYGGQVKHKVRMRGTDYTFWVLPPLAVRAFELSVNGNYKKPLKKKNNNPKKDDPSAARYNIVLDGMAYDDAVKDPKDRFHRNRDYVRLEKQLNELKRWAIAAIWYSPEERIPSIARNSLKEIERRTRAKNSNDPELPLEEVISYFETDPLKCRGLIVTPQPREDSSQPPESRTYISLSRRVFAKDKENQADPKASGYGAPKPAHIDAAEPCPPGFHRMPLKIYWFTKNMEKRRLDPTLMTRDGINQIKRGDVMSCMVDISLGPKDRNPDTNVDYTLNLKFEGAPFEGDFWFGTGKNAVKITNADRSCPIGDDEFDAPDELPGSSSHNDDEDFKDAAEAYANRPVTDEVENAEAPMEVDSPTTASLKRKGMAPTDDDDDDDDDEAKLATEHIAAPAAAPTESKHDTTAMDEDLLEPEPEPEPEPDPEPVAAPPAKKKAKKTDGTAEPVTKTYAFGKKKHAV